MTLFNFNGSTNWFLYWTTSVSIPTIQNDLISTVLNWSYTWNILSIFYWSLSWNIDDDVQITLQWLPRQISIHCGITSPVVMGIPQSSTGPYNLLLNHRSFDLHMSKSTHLKHLNHLNIVFWYLCKICVYREKHLIVRLQYGILAALEDTSWFLRHLRYSKNSKLSEYSVFTIFIDNRMMK